MLRCCQTAELISNSTQAGKLGLAPLPVFVRGDIFEVHGLVSHHKAEVPPESDGVSCGTTNLIKNASHEGRSWKTILKDHPGFEAWFVATERVLLLYEQRICKNCRGVEGYFVFATRPPHMPLAGCSSSDAPWSDSHLTVETLEEATVRTQRFVDELKLMARQASVGAAPRIVVVVSHGMFIG